MTVTRFLRFLGTTCQTDCPPAWDSCQFSPLVWTSVIDTGNIPEDSNLRHQRCENRLWCGHTSYSYKRCWDPGKGWEMGDQASLQEERQVDISHNGTDAAQGLPSSSCCCPNSTTWNTRKQLGRRQFPTEITNLQQRVPKYSSYRVAQKNVYTLAAVRRLRQCLDADGGHFEHLHWIQNSRTSLISILLLYKYSSYAFSCQSVYTFFWATLYLRQNTWDNRSAAARSKVQFIFGTEHLSRLICTPGSHLVGTEFESRIGYESQWLSFLIFLIPSRKSG